MSSDNADAPTLLCVIFDVNPSIWQLREKYAQSGVTKFDELVQSLIVFVNSFLLSNRCNQIYIIANHPEFSSIAYPQNLGGTGSKPEDTGGLENAICEALTSIIRVSCHKTPPEIAMNALPRSLGNALCIINGQLIRSPLKFEPRILVLQISRDNPSAYTSIMNCIFSTQKIGAPIDTMVFARDDSRFLQQASYLSGGIYLRPDDQTDHLQLLTSHYLASNSTRSKLLRMPFQQVVDFKATCFCHGKAIEYAFMCSVCLALTCEASEVCATCGITVRKPE
jgi:transcription initiation factor TFIIH subunit 3